MQLVALRIKKHGGNNLLTCLKLSFSFLNYGRSTVGTVGTPLKITAGRGRVFLFSNGKIHRKP